jgi:hypothetical protein
VSVLTFHGETHIRLPWTVYVNVRAFGFDAADNDAEAIAKLLEHDQYQDAFEGPTGVGQGRHGPYRIEHLSAASYLQLPTVEAIDQIKSLVVDASEIELTDDMSADVRALCVVAPGTGTLLQENVYDTFTAADVAYQLRVLPESALGPPWQWQSVDSFHEYMSINRAGKTLTLVVCAY